MELANEAFASVTCTTTVQALNLQEKRVYTLVHPGIDAALASDTNPILLAVAPEVPSATPAKNRLALLSGMSIEIGGENGPMAVAFKVLAGAPLLYILSGDLAED